MQRRKLEELSLMDDFLFNAMLTHPETGEKFTNKILKLLFNREFKNLRVSVQKVYAGIRTIRQKILRRFQGGQDSVMQSLTEGA